MFHKGRSTCGWCDRAPRRRGGGDEAFRRIKPEFGVPRNFLPPAGQQGEFACPGCDKASTKHDFDPRLRIKGALPERGSTPEHPGGPSDLQIPSAVPVPAGESATPESHDAISGGQRAPEHRPPGHEQSPASPSAEQGHFPTISSQGDATVGGHLEPPMVQDRQGENILCTATMHPSSPWEWSWEGRYVAEP